jgi:hypothetical protein
MSKCDFSIDLDRDDATYAPGDRITGTVQMCVNEDFEHRRIVVIREWRTHGRGNHAKGGREEIELESAGSCRAGDEQSYTFAFEAPNGPCTYHGHHLNVDWYLEARADLRLARDPKTDREIVIAPGERTVATYMMGDVAADESVASHDVATKQRRIGSRVATVIGLVLVTGALTALFFTAPRLADGSLSALFGSLGGSLVLVFGVILGFRGLRNPLARRRLGQLTVHVDPHIVRPGENVTVRIHSPAVSDATIESALLTLTAEEVVTQGSGTDAVTHRHPLHRQQIRLIDLPHAIRQGSLELNGEVPIPETGRYSFRTTDNELRWTLAVRLALPRWPDLHEDVPIVVRP